MLTRKFSILFVLLISLAAGGSALGQRPSRSPARGGSSQDDLALAAITRRDIPTKRAFRHHERILWKYDKVKDITVVNLDKMWVGDHFRLSAYFGCYGQGCDASTPSFIRIYITTASSSGWRLKRATTMEIIADGKSMRLQPEYEREIEPAKSIAGSTYGPHKVEYLQSDLSTRTFLKIVNAQRVEMRIGKERFSLTENNLEALRDLASRLPVRQ